ncbi:alpha/beta fold hydrolase [Nocardiopsis sp. LDBS1602]|uniref:alpha/beta fold hydrolase n=1 Tax=Nocardiopsis sp. LDBS1602 TaxID=3109597 RepID=UPI002DB9DE52|nr:alpha/beta hydrolase [Nocardiopsis sp. LDBS1602]MEC3890964.1 alpha/beta hydrolase [Nocardiopsis sp. LDBS1602]
MMHSETALVGDLRMHYLRAGSGPLLVLLHGWPQTSHCWRHVMPTLAEHYTVIAPDLRGYGLTDKPVGGYDKRTMATDVRALARRFDDGPIRLVGHDRGARVAHRYALDHPDEVERMALLDIAPTLATFRRTSMTVARNYWHWLFHMQPDLPEELVGGRHDTYLRYFFERWTVNRSAVEEAIDHYVDAFSRPGALRAGFDDYRATHPEDLDADEADQEAGRRLTMPLLVLWGDAGLPAALPVADIWREYADDVTGEALEDCGHFLPEERPAELVDRLLRFL